MRYRLLLIITMLSWAIMIAAQEPQADLSTQLTISNIKVHRADSAMIVISLSNPVEEYNGLQLDLQLPEGITLCNNKRSGYIYHLSDRLKTLNPSVFIKQQSTGFYKILIFSFNLSPFSGDTGPIISMPITTYSNIKRRKYLGKATEIILNKKDNKSFHYKDIVFQIKVKK